METLILVRAVFIYRGASEGECVRVYFDKFMCVATAVLRLRARGGGIELPRRGCDAGLLEEMRICVCVMAKGGGL